jgi:hypothetical protein
VWLGSGRERDQRAVLAELRVAGHHVAHPDRQQQRAGHDEAVAHGLVEQ